MFKTIRVGEKELDLSANAATPFRFKQVFKKDLLSTFSSEEKAEKEGFEAVSELAYIMAKHAEHADMNKLNEEDFINWLEGFEPMDFAEAAEDILGVYMGNLMSSATP